MTKKHRISAVFRTFIQLQVLKTRTADVNISRNLVLENRSVSFAFPDYRKDTHPSPAKVKVLPLNLGETDDWGIYAITRKDEEITLAQQLFIEFMQSQARMESPAIAAGVR